MGSSSIPVVPTAIHAGHDLRPAVAARVRIDDAARRREEDPFTELIAAGAGPPTFVHRSRFEVDLNRPRDRAVYTTPAASWGLELWDDPLPDDVVDRSLAVHDRFYADLARLLDPIAARGPFVVLDVHSYNHRRDGADEPAAPPADNPEVNVGTGSLDRDRWGGLVDRFMADLRRQEVAGHPLDVRENVRFEGGHLSHWVHERYDGVGCALALEFKKLFMDEWTGEVDLGHVDALAAALAATVPGLCDGLA
jgi:N-formylglutamate amidohydrolase